MLLPLCLLMALLIPHGFSAEEGAEPNLFLRPHCADDATTCATYTVKDPDTLQTAPQKLNSQMHMDLVLSNPGKRQIARVRAWLQYNSVVLEGKGITAGATLPTPTPGELEFSATDGLVKIDVSAKTGEEPADEEIVVGRLLLTVKSVPQTQSDVLSFYDVQPTGHTRVIALKTGGGNEDILTQNPGSLLVAFEETASGSSVSSVATGSGSSSTSHASESGSSVSSVMHGAGSGSSAISSSRSSAAAAVCGNGIKEAGEQCDDGNFIAGDGCSIACSNEVQSSSSIMTGSGSSSVTSAQSSVALLPDGTVCSSHSDCRGGLCSGGICRGDILKVEDGNACMASGNCLSGICENNRCAVATQSSSSTSGLTAPIGGTAFALLQVRNVRITTEGTSLYVAWDPLASSQLKGYNLYYGTTSGRYIQRKTISPESTSMAIRSLPEKTTYFVSIRALSSQDEESAFSQEVAVEVGSPQTSTAPLTGDLLSTRKPVTVPGETGMPSVIALILTISAVTGTALASRRQLVATINPPRA
ncbi:hypothetical protein AUJ46_05485 [Candidatus Peregrinibacteria bacterium CG1_02_54_53]|nr:MAG: hypothetical protein AUJ46_05485 [Candidatus Peregrinibacteria bacterium CG1_02_54_53]